MRSLIAAIRFLTRLSIPGPATRSEDLSRAVAWFPLIGAAIGALIGGAYCGAAHWWPPAIAGVIAIAFGLLLTGGFHEDAVADASDGLGGGHDNDSVLRIMKDSRVGSFAVMGLWVLLSLRWAALQRLDAQSVLGLAFASAWGRWSSAPLIALVPSLSAGIGKDIQGRSGIACLVATFFVAAVSVAAWHQGLTHAVIAAGAAIIVTALWGVYLRRRLGGHTGDLLGAGNQLVEAAALLAICARVP